MFASTNLVAELGIILYLLMGWQFMAGAWIGGEQARAKMTSAGALSLTATSWPARKEASSRSSAALFFRYRASHPLSETQRCLAPLGDGDQRRVELARLQAEYRPEQFVNLTPRINPSFLIFVDECVVKYVGDRDHPLLEANVPRLIAANVPMAL
jgi:hypothetical protein